MQTLNVYDELNKSIDSNPDHNYEVLLKSIKDVKDKCLPKKVVKYNKKKHKKSKWMTFALLKSINIKQQLYKKWIKTDVNNVELCSRLKEEFKSYYNTLRRSGVARVTGARGKVKFCAPPSKIFFKMILKCI